MSSEPTDKTCAHGGNCVPACPEKLSAQLRERARMLERARTARQRFEARNARLQRDSDERSERELHLQASATSEDAVEAAIARALARRNAGPKP